MLVDYYRVDGDLLMIQDTGAHGIAMDFNYNGKLRPQELLLRSDGKAELLHQLSCLGDAYHETK